MLRLLFSIILVVAAILIFVMPTRALLDSTTPIKNELVQIADARGNARKILEARDKLQEEYNSFSNDDLDKLHKLVPNHVDNVRIIIEVNNIAVSRGMLISGISIEEKSANPSENLPEGSTIGSTPSAFSSLQFTFNITGQYDGLKLLLSDIERSVRILDLEGISFGQPRIPTDPYLFTLKLRTYWVPNNNQEL